MRRSRWMLVLAAAPLALAPRPAAAASEAEVEAQLATMQERLAQMEDRLRATNEKLAEAERRAEATPAVSSGNAPSGLAGFVDRLEIGGWVAGSYFYNFENPDGRDLGGFNAGSVPAYPFHPDANSFQLDQAWLELEHPVSEAHRAGFRLDFVFGKTAELLNANAPAFVVGTDLNGDGLVTLDELSFTTGENADGFSGSDEDFELYQAYVQYLAPIGEGVTFQFGKFATVIGAEVAQSPYNFNITRGHVYNLFQPITHVGLLASSELGHGFSGKLGLVNETRSFPGADIDLNKNKALLWSLGWGGETVSASFNGAWGASDSGQGADTFAGDKETILDLILAWNPNDRFSSYINADYIKSENDLRVAPPLPVLTGEFDGYGVAVAGRYALTERLGLALRGEWVSLAFENAGGADPDLRVWGLTSTLDFALTDHLKLRGEVRYDVARQGSGGLNNVFFNSGGPLSARGVPGSGQVSSEDDQLVGGVEVIYSF